MNASSDSSDVFKTPSPRRKKGQRNLFTDTCIRIHTPRTPDRFRNENTQHLSSTATSCSPLQHITKERSRTEPLPDKFRREMPMSARKAEPTAIPPSDRDFLPIRQSSFYGSKTKTPIVSFTSSYSSSPSPSVHKTSPNTERKFASKARSALDTLPSQSCDALSMKYNNSKIQSKKSGMV